MCHNVPLWAARGRYPSRPRSPTLLLIRWLGSSRSALSRLAWAHAHETLLWAGKRGSHHTFNYDLINSRSPSASRRRNHRWVMRLALPDGIMPPGQNIRWQEDGGSGDGTFVAVRGLRPAGWSSGAERLRLLNRVKWPTTEPLLEAAGLRAGMSCLDVGCGGGDVTLKMAALVGTEGHVVGVDRDQSVLQLARQETEEQGLPVTFRRLEAEELAEESAYDLVFARYLLSHLPRPQRAVEAMVRAARPGGAWSSKTSSSPVTFATRPTLPSIASWSSTRPLPGRRRAATRRSGYACWGWRSRPDWSMCASGWSCPLSARARASGLHGLRWSTYGGRWLAPDWHPIPRWTKSSASWAGSPTTTGR